MASKLGKIVADFRTSLAVKISAGGTTGTIQSATDDDGVALPTGLYFFTIDGDNSQKEHIFCTLTGQALSDIKSVSRQGIQITGCAREHRIGATVTITDFAHISYINDILRGVDGLDGTSPVKYDVTPTFTDDLQLVNKGYVDGVVVAGGVDANIETRGISNVTISDSGYQRTMSSLTRAQNTPDMTLKVLPFKHIEAEKNIDFAGGNSGQFINPSLAGDLSLQTNPTNGETFTLTINGTNCVFTFVSSIGSTAGNVLIGGTATITRANLAALINAPGTTNANQVAFTGAQLAALGYVNGSDNLTTTIFIKALVSTVTTLTATEAMAGANNTWTINTTKNRIDILVLQTSDSTIQIRRGTEAVGPTAPTPTSGDICLSNVYCSVGMSSVKNTNDSTNAYIMNWYFPQVYGSPVPSGVVSQFAGASIPGGWVLCDGSAVSRASYPFLFSAIGTLYGSGDGSTTFNIPNLKNRVPIGVDTSVKVTIDNCDAAWTAGSNVTASLDSVDKQQGTNSVKLAVAAGATAAQILGYRAISSTDLREKTAIGFWIKSSIALNSGDIKIRLDDTAAIASPIESLNIPALVAGVWTKVYLNLATPNLDSAIISVGLYQVNDKGAFDLWIDDIAAGENYELGAIGGEKLHLLTTEEMPSHTHEMSTAVTTGSIAINNGGSNGVNTSGGSTAGKGGGRSHNNLQPYITLNFIIKA